MCEPLCVMFAYVKICYSMLKVLMCFLVRRKMMMMCHGTRSGGNKWLRRAWGEVSGNSEQTFILYTLFFCVVLIIIHVLCSNYD